MTLTKSYHNSFRQWWSVYTWSLKKQSGIGIIYLILLCLALPFLLGIILFSSIKIVVCFYYCCFIVSIHA